MKKAAPAIPLFGDAYLADTRHLTLEEHGAYLQLLMIAWRTDGCCLPADDARLARMLGVTGKKWSKLKPEVMAFWECDEGSWRQRRLTKERRWVDKKSEQNADAAKARHDANRLKDNDGDDANASGNGCERSAPPPPPLKEEDSVANATGADAPKPPADLKADVFNSGVSLLTSTGTAERNARSMIGRWLKTYGDAPVLAVLVDAQARAIPDPIPWITRALENRYGGQSGIGVTARAAISVFGPVEQSGDGIEAGHA